MTETSSGGFRAWFWQGQSIREGRAAIAAKSPRRRELEQFALTAAEAGDRALHPVTPLRSGPGEVVSGWLHRQSIRATLSALDSSVELLAEDEPLRRRVASAVAGAISQDRFFELIGDPPDVDPVDVTLHTKPGEADALARAARALLDVARAPERQLQKGLAKRAVRTTVASLSFVAVAIIVAIAGVHFVRGPDLAAGKPWKASSSYRGFSAEDGICDKRKTNIFFHTNREKEPWVEIDLGEPTPIHRVDIRNRRDCCRDRSYPLAVEASADGEEWVELGRQTDPFFGWTLEFEPTVARYVRAKAKKRTFLHLEQFEVR